ncbi:MAG: nucleoside hydrolase [Acidobacteriota bacterium]|nr:nucleoside hydrolase [Acidobacteriota bacterium]
MLRRSTRVPGVESLATPIVRRAFLRRAGLLLAAAGAPPTLFGQAGGARRGRVILDVDIGIDDAFAVLLAHFSPTIDLLGITTAFGNTTLENSTRNALYIKERFGVEAQVYRGAAEPLHHPRPEPPVFVHGEDGLGDVEGPIAPAIREADLSAPEFIARAILGDPGEVTVVTLGPATNLMLARLLEPAIVDHVRDVIVMGGAVGFAGERGNITTVAEANAWQDPHAMADLFRFPWPVTMVGLDVTYAADASMDEAFIEELRTRAGEAGAFLERINRQYRRFYRSSRGVDVTFQHDSIAVAYAIAPSLFEVERGKVKVLTDGVARGQTVFCPEGHHTFGDPEWAGLPTHRVCRGIDGPGFLDLYARALIGGGARGGGRRAE